MKRIKSGDTVIVIAGKSKGHIGKVVKVFADDVIVEGANLIKKHVKKNPQLQQDGGIITREAQIDTSNVAIYNPVSKMADKVGFKYLEKEGKKHKVRYFKSNDEVIDIV
ncbi:MAG: 50S ribosomal protein L24 [Tatlockia sp.]|nr:50S ribosomal protein L24 [Tatlockia sp.]